MVAILFFVFCRVGSLLVINDIQQEENVDYTSVAQTIEANPIMVYLISMQGIYLMGFSILLPAIGIAFYLFLRAKTLKEDFDLDYLALYVNIIYIFLALNVINDSIYMVSKIGGV